MSDIMRPIPFNQLISWVLNEYRGHGSIFGVAKLVKHTDGKALPIFKEKIESPFGPAAGPNTQLAQNIIASYVAGSRFFELKTVQIMDGEELAKCVAKPCITAGDECYNCEWSTELYVPQAYDEYVKAWFACKLLAKELGLGDPDGFVFNMSVGYDLAGIKSDKIDKYIEGMKDASGSVVWAECMDWTLANLDCFEHVDVAYVKAISPKVSDSITESTLHGCPPDEIERIASYLITEKNLNTYVKCNPTLLGYEFARKTLDDLGYDYIQFDDHHFKEDLQREDAFPMFRRLIDLTKSKGLEFGVKLTNTFPVDVAAGELPSEEMYMSGRSLYPLTISLAAIISKEFEGKLRISYSGGADFGNIEDLFSAGIWPITMATTVLKPGGYERFSQIGETLTGKGGDAFTGVDAAKVAALAEAAKSGERYTKPIKPLPQRKMNKPLPLIDCFDAPCRESCPIHQDIPAYLKRAGEGKYDEALSVILQRNALPFITGTICPHPCGQKCMRNYYEDTVHIREVKLESAAQGFAEVLSTMKPKTPQTGKKVAIVGGGPAGIAAAFFLAREGVDVTVFERKSTPGGIVRHVVPEFRITAGAVDRDVDFAKAMGAKFELGAEVKSAEELKAKGYTHVILATGAWIPGSAGLQYGEEMNVIHFLEQARSAPEKLNLGKDVVVIGGGNTAMDAARAAKRIPGVENVRLVYRRTKRYMPADEEELALAIEDGVEFLELLAPVGVKDGKLTCQVMELGAPDASGRRSPVDTGKTVDVPASIVITAVGELVDSALFKANGLELDKRGKAVVSESMESSVKNLYVVGDARRGPATVVEAIADATAAAVAIAGFDPEVDVEKNISPEYDKAKAKHGDLHLDVDPSHDKRCLACSTVCEACTEVCPNRANIAVRVPGMRQRQIVHVDGMCNECGNCGTFCPYNGLPYKDKFTLYWSEEDFRNSTNAGWLPKGDGSGVCLVRLGDEVKEYDVTDEHCGLYEDVRQLIQAVRESYGYLIK
ncbi:putative oxidoreductase, Fe-S subunit [uncultured Eubacteriales bacterium]|uniref:Putative oxidoreductase, Fe-S subunit n=1 Tax=uncultured Eubacteriales bacterium TaxID=172733 RepID=A0A212KGP7_9FIRM|nr:putative oxidoreductase, Fe-S subunit [uncultured Eubacteriales bacterium]